MSENNIKREETEGVNLLRGNPKEAVKKLSLPFICCEYSGTTPAEIRFPKLQGSPPML